MSEYPELDKMLVVQKESQTIGDFLLDSKYVLAEWKVDEHGEDVLMPVFESIEKVLAAYFGIDLQKAEAEKRQILAQLEGTKP